MSCSTRPAVRSYLNFIEEYLGETITQNEWHQIRWLAEIEDADGFLNAKARAEDNWRVVGVAVFDGTPVDFPIAKAYPSAQDAEIAADEGTGELTDGDWLVNDLSELTSAEGNENTYLEDVQVRKMNDAEYAAALLDSSILREHLDNEWEPNGDELSRRYVDLANSVKEHPPTQGTVKAIEYLAVNGVKETLENLRAQELERKSLGGAPAFEYERRPLKIKNPHYDMTSTVVDDIEGGGYEIEVENPRWKHSVIASPENDQYEREIKVRGFSGSVRIGMQGELGVQESAAFIALAAEERLRWEGRNDLDDLQWTVPDGWGMD